MAVDVGEAVGVAVGNVPGSAVAPAVTSGEGGGGVGEAGISAVRALAGASSTNMNGSPPIWHQFVQSIPGNSTK